jgi:hypothetical protein
VQGNADAFKKGGVCTLEAPKVGDGVEQDSVNLGLLKGLIQSK